MPDDDAVAELLATRRILRVQASSAYVLTTDEATQVAAASERIAVSITRWWIDRSRTT